MTLQFIISLFCIYLFSSVLFSVLIARVCGVKDIRTKGSNNAGGSNVMRICGKKAGAAAILCDTAKGFIPVIILKHLGYSDTLLYVAGLTSVMGHIFSVFYNFKGGKGVATIFGFYLAMNPMYGITFAAIWIIVLRISSISSISSIIALSTITFLSSLHNDIAANIVLLATYFLIIYKHKQNIINIMNKTENTITK